MRVLVSLLAIVLLAASGCGEARAQDLGGDGLMRGAMSGKGDMSMPGAPVCGNGLATGSEGCDDSNLYSGDGCSSACAVETGFSCTGAPSVCTSADLVGGVASLAQQCTGSALKTQNPNVTITFARASNAWCTKSDGTMVLMSNNQPRRERSGLLFEPASTGNSIVGPRDLTDAAWTAADITAAKTATGPDGVANSASTITATADNGTIKQTVTTAAATRSSSMRIRRRTGTGNILVTRNDFVAEANITASVTSTWKWVRARCGPEHTEAAPGMQRVDPTLRDIPNCIAVSAFTGSVLNPTIGIKLATSGDAVDIDMVQDEAASHATSPQTGFTRAVEAADMSADKASLPVNNFEVSVDYTTLWTADGLSGDHFPFLTYSAASAGIQPDIIRSAANIATTNKKTGVGADTFTTGTLYSFTGISQNYRWSYGTVAAKMRFWRNGYPFGEDATATSIPDAHAVWSIGGNTTGGNNLSGWLSRVKFTSGSAYADFKGSQLLVIPVGDSIVTGSPSYNTAEQSPPYLLETSLGGSLATERYVYNDGLSGRTITQCETAWNAHLAAIAAAGIEDRAVMILQCGTNSLTALGAAGVFAVWESMADDAVAAGVKFVPATVTPTGGQSTEDDLRVLILGWCTTNSRTCADTYAVMDDPGTPGQMLAALHGGDGLHPDVDGNSVMVPEWVRAGRVDGYW